MSAGRVAGQVWVLAATVEPSASSPEGGVPLKGSVIRLRPTVDQSWQPGERGPCDVKLPCLNDQEPAGRPGMTKAPDSVPGLLS